MIGGGGGAPAAAATLEVGAAMLEMAKAFVQSPPYSDFGAVPAANPWDGGGQAAGGAAVLEGLDLGAGGRSSSTGGRGRGGGAGGGAVAAV